MTNGGQRPDPTDFRIENEMDLLFGRAHPNPAREGCPPPELLRRLARRELPIGDPAYDHFAKCSPCYKELRTLQQADAARLARARRRRTMLAAAAVVVVAIAGVWLMTRPTDHGAQAPATAKSTQAVAQSARLDLRPLAVTRSEDRKTDTPPLEVPRGRVDATILLPVGASPGVYEIRILDKDLTARATAKGSANIRDFVTTLEAAIDASALAPGDYQLTLRREGGEWQMFPLRVR
jgi:hypothetical protein